LAKKLQLNIKSTQLEKALKLKKQLQKGEEEKAAKKKPPAKPAEEAEAAPKPRRIRARTKSAFAEAEGERAAVTEERVVAEEISPPAPEPSAPVAEAIVVESAAITRPPPAPPAVEERPAPGPRVAPKAPPPRAAAKKEPRAGEGEEPAVEEEKKPAKEKKRKTFRDLKPKFAGSRFDVRDRQGLGAVEEERWRKRRAAKAPRRLISEELTVRPTELAVRLPISIKDLAAAMKVKASQLISKLLMQGVAMTLNDLLEDETTIQLLGQDFGCEISIDHSEEERLQITDQTIKAELESEPRERLLPRAPVVTFMGHVDHGKTSLIDRIRQTNVAAAEAGAITQHIGAFQTQTRVGPITILDTPGHEAFTSMRARGADVTDVVVLVVAGDEGIRPQTDEAIQHAQAAGVTLMVALNKSDKPTFNAENVYRQLAERELLPEVWGGRVVTINCSALTGEGMDELLEMIALQAEVLELRANPDRRARGTVLESQMHKGMGVVATVLVQNGTLKHGDAVVLGGLWGRVKTMQDEFGNKLTEAGPATPVAITGLSGLPSAGSEFIVVSSEKEAREIAEARQMGYRERTMQKKRRLSMEHLLEEAASIKQKQLNLILRADVQGSLEALRQSLQKIESEKARLEIIFAGVGAISESDVELAIVSQAVIIGFHTHVESHADELVKQARVQVRLHDIIYHAIDDVKQLMAGRLEKIAQARDMGAAQVRATFKASQLGTIAGCYVTEGVISRGSRIRQIREGELIWEGGITSIRREKDDVREVKAGLECGILLEGRNDVREGDTLQAYEVIYIAQEL
jgi:translation initiation factor IF-2